MKQLYYVLQTLKHGIGGTLIKIISIGLGLTVCCILFARVAFELSYDRNFNEPDKLYQLWSSWVINGEELGEQTMNIGKLTSGVYEAFSDEVEGVTSIGEWMCRAPLYNGKQRFDQYKVMADSLFFTTMGIDVLKGNPVTDLSQKDIIYLNETLAQRMFGDEDPINKVISYDNVIDLTVKGVYKDIAENSTMKPNAVISMPTGWSRNWGNYSWDGGDSWIGYVRLKDNIDVAEFNKRIDLMVKQHVAVRPEISYMGYIKPLRDTYRQQEEVKRMNSILLLLGFSILLITALNYVLISISSLSRRAKAIGVHKCNGADAGNIFGMFIIETAIIIFLALLMMALLLINFSDFVEDTACASLASLFAAQRLWVIASVILLLFIIGGVLPGFIFSKIPVTQVFRRYTENQKSWKRPLLFVQFLGVTFIFGLLSVIILQYHYVINKETGYNPERVVVGLNYARNYDAHMATRNFYEQLPYVEEVSSSISNPVSGYSGEMIPDENGNRLFSTRYDYGSADYIKFMRMELLEGRAPDKKGEVAVNKTFVDKMNWTSDVIGRKIGTEEDVVTIVGVIKDFVIQGLFNTEMMPYVLHFHPSFGSQVYLRLKEPFADNLNRLNADVAEQFPGRTNDFKSMEKETFKLYNPIRVFRNAVIMASITILFITFMGLIGYINDELQRRSKEIAIRKVNGAETTTILKMIIKNIVYIALPAVAVGVIVAWYVGDICLSQFSSTISSPIPYYLLVGVLVLLFIIATVVIKAWRIANEDPVISIKSE